MLGLFGKLTVKEHVCPTRSGTSPESFHPFSERFQTVPWPWNRPAWYVTEHCSGERREERSVKGPGASLGGVL